MGFTKNSWTHAFKLLKKQWGFKSRNGREGSLDARREIFHPCEVTPPDTRLAHLHSTQLCAPAERQMGVRAASAAYLRGDTYVAKQPDAIGAAR